MQGSFGGGEEEMTAKDGVRCRHGQLRVGFLMATPPGFFGGYERFVEEMTRALSSHNIEPHRISGPRVLVWAAYKLTRIGSGGKRAWKLRRGSGRVKPRSCDVLYVKNDVLDLLAALFVRRRPPIVVGVHSSRARPNGSSTWLRDTMYSDRVYLSLLRRLDPMFHVVANDVDVKWLRLRFGSERVRYIPNFIVTSEVASSETAGLPSRRLLFVGRLTAQKGVDLVLEAAELLAAEGDRMEIAVAGNGELESVVRASSRVRYVGFSSDVTSLMRDYSWVVVPSRWEQAPLVLREVLGAGVPYVLSAIPCFDGYHLDPSLRFELTSADLARVLRRIVSMSNEDYQEIKEVVLKRAAGEPSLDYASGQLAKLVCEAFGRRGVVR